MPIDIWQDMVLLVKVVPILLPIHIIRILGPHILLVRLIFAWPRSSLVLSSLLEVFLYNQIGDRGGANLFPSCCDAFEEFRDCSWFLWFMLLVVSSGRFEDAGFTEELVVCDKGDDGSEGYFYARGVKPIVAA